MTETHEQVMREEKLPRMGQTVRSKVYATLWRVLEKREIWQNAADDPETGEARIYRQFITRIGECVRE